MKVLTLKLRNQDEWEFISRLLRRLNIRFEWKEDLSENFPELNHDRSEKDIVDELYGSWPSDQSSDEIIADLKAARVNQTHEITL